MIGGGALHPATRQKCRCVWSTECNSVSNVSLAMTCARDGKTGVRQAAHRMGAVGSAMRCLREVIMHDVHATALHVLHIETGLDTTVLRQ